MNVIVLTGGGTAGHCVPCFSLLPELKKTFDEIYYIGSKDKIESKLAKKHNVTFFYVPTVKFERRFTFKHTLIPFKLLLAVNSAKHILKNLKPTVVFSKGGYVALPVVIAANQLKIPVVSHESDLSLGLANKIALRYSTKLLTGFKETAKGINKAEYTGIPLNPQLFKQRNTSAVKKKYNLSTRKKTVLITGGSQGSAAINSVIFKSITDLTKKYNVIWLTGKDKKPNVCAQNLLISEFADDMGELYSVADLCVTRAGANTLFELIALKIPSLAIPLPKGNSRGDQEENAAYFQRKKAITVLKESDLSPERLLSAIDDLSEKSRLYSENCEKLNLSDANVKVAEIICEVANLSK